MVVCKPIRLVNFSYKLHEKFLKWTEEGARFPGGFLDPPMTLSQNTKQP